VIFYIDHICPARTQVTTMSHQNIAWSMKPTDCNSLFSNSDCSAGDFFFKPYPKTKDNMGGTDGRWNNPAKNKANFMSTSPVSSCCQFSTGSRDWSGQGDDITTLVEKLEKHKKVFTDHKVQNTVSSPPNFWVNACSSSSSTSLQQENLPFSSGFNSKSSRNGNAFIFGGNSGFSSNNQSTFGSRTSNSMKNSYSNRFSTNSNYENDRLMQMDWIINFKT